jgi:N-acetylneuraminate synthase/N,N'-diacetyllegionaminate synthase
MHSSKTINNTTPVYFIAEAGVNHNGDVELAKELIEIAAEAGANAVKFQMFTADRLATENAPRADYQRETTENSSQFEMLKRYELGQAEHERLKRQCERRGITFLSTPFDRHSADLLDELGVSRFKIGSGEIDNHPLLTHIARLGRPMIVSTGMSTMDEVHDAYDVIRSIDSNIDLTFLHCTSEYPTALENVNLRAMETMTSELPVPIGYSDHTPHVETPAFAAAAGAAVVEKHITTDKTLPGPDHEFALEPAELSRAVRLVRNATAARGSSEKVPTEGERGVKQVVRKSIRAARNVEAGERLTEDSIVVKRPANGLSPTALETVLGTRTRVALERGDPITDDVIEE